VSHNGILQVEISPTLKKIRLKSTYLWCPKMASIHPNCLP